ADVVCQKVITRFLHYRGEGNERIEGRIQHCWPLPVAAILQAFVVVISLINIVATDGKISAI
ncbi:hypothetical protein A2U01_0019759, partial [Trifolium medium]|nr:hypothetical protein [Trifolium medium]